MAKRMKGATGAKKNSPSQGGGPRELLKRSGSNAVLILGRTWTGAEDVGREVGVTAIAAVRGSMTAAGQIGGDLVEVTRAAVEGTLDAAERIGTAATRAVRHIVSPEAGLGSATVLGRPRRQPAKAKAALKAVKSSPKPTEAAS